MNTAVSMPTSSNVFKARPAYRTPIALPVVFGLGLLLVEVFLRDVGLAPVHSWECAAVLAICVTFAIRKLPRDGLAQALTWFATLQISGFLIAYDLLDSLVDPFVNADLSIALIAFLIVLLVEMLLVAASVEDD